LILDFRTDGTALRNQIKNQQSTLINRQSNDQSAETDCTDRRLEYAPGMTIEVEQEMDGRWIAEAPDIPGAMVYGATQAEAVAKVEALVLRILADRLDHGEMTPGLEKVFTVAA
jgi:predicted RNase H-like HicB family nuclease